MKILGVYCESFMTTFKLWKKTGKVKDTGLCILKKDAESFISPFLY